MIPANVVAEYASGQERGWYKFPQYLWIIAIRGRPVILRRGNTPEEAIEKALVKEGWARTTIGILPYCNTTDARLYSNSHPWDWLNE